jgi:hypothetical protein
MSTRNWIMAGLAFVAAGGVGGAAALQSRPNDGFLYGVVTTESGTEYTGFIRWGTEESFWDDLLHSAKTNLEEARRAARKSDDQKSDRERDRDDEHSGSFDFSRWRIRWRDEMGASRIFIVRFGDVREIVVTGDNAADIIVKSGTTIPVEGASNDVGNKIEINDEKLGKVELHWNRIERIQFKPAPSGADPGATRLFGSVEADAGSFEGWIQWDKQECRSDDRLDGESEDGDVSIEMGKIKSIERRSRRASRVELEDGRTLTLEGTNDVNDENRGIVVEDARFGRVTVPWSEFRKLTFKPAAGSGTAYGAYKSIGALRGTVTDTSGQTITGRIVFDLDESEGWEMLNGSDRDLQYDIPFVNVASIEVLDAGACRVVLRSGAELELEDSQDVTGDNDGVLVYTSDKEAPRYLEWQDVEKLVFQP